MWPKFSPCAVANGVASSSAIFILSFYIIGVMPWKRRVVQRLLLGWKKHAMVAGKLHVHGRNGMVYKIKPLPGVAMIVARQQHHMCLLAKTKLVAATHASLCEHRNFN
jgi:hypothetical protein